MRWSRASAGGAGVAPAAAGAGGGLWIGTHTGGLSEYRQGRFRTYGPRDGYAPTGILALLSDRDGARQPSGAALSALANDPDHDAEIL